MENFKGMKKGTTKTLKAATAAFVLTSGVAVSTSVVGPDVAQAKLGEEYEIYHPSDNPAEETITISSENTADNPARATGSLSDYWIGYYTTYEDGETQYMLINQDSKFFVLSEGIQTVNLIHDYGDEQGNFEVTATVDTTNIDGEPTVTPADVFPSDPDEVPEEDTTDDSTNEEAPAQDTTDEGTEEAPAEDSPDEGTDEEAPADDSTDEGIDEAPAEDTTDEDTDEAPAEDSTDEGTDEEAPAQDTTDEDTDKAPADDSPDEGTEGAPEDDSTDDSTDEAPAEDSTDDSTDEEAPAQDTTDEGTDEATTDNVSDENTGSDSEKAEEVKETASASEGDNDSEMEDITSLEDVEKLPRTGGDTAPLSAAGGLMVLLSSAVLAFRKKFSKE